VTAVAPDFELPSIDAGPVRLSDLLTRSGRVLLLFVHGDCPTSLLALDRLGPLASKLEHRGLPLVVVAQETTEAAARLACRHGVLATVLADAAPHDVSAAFAVDVVPTALLVGDAGAVIGRAVGWSAEAFQELLPVPVPDGEPRWKPGCGSRTVEGYETPATDELEEMFELGWTDGLPVVPPTPERVEAMLGGRDPCVSLGEVPPAMGEATLERVASCAVLAGCRPQSFPSCSPPSGPCSTPPTT
jgi:peroxiredoxin